MTIEDRVKKVIAKQFSLDENQITPETYISEDLGADNIDMVELVMALEEEFSVEITDGEIEGIMTVGHILDCLKKQGVS